MHKCPAPMYKLTDLCVFLSARISPFTTCMRALEDRDRCRKEAHSTSIIYDNSSGSFHFLFIVLVAATVLHTCIISHAMISLRLASHLRFHANNHSVVEVI